MKTGWSLIVAGAVGCGAKAPVDAAATHPAEPRTSIDTNAPKHGTAPPRVVADEPTQASIHAEVAARALPPATVAAAGGNCRVGEPVVVGRTSSSPVRGAGVQLAASTHGRWAAWRDGPDDLAVQPLDLELRPRGSVSRVAFSRPRGTVGLFARGDKLLVATHASCTRTFQHCIGVRWVDINGAAVTQEWEYETHRGDPIGVVRASVGGLEALAYTYRYWSPLIVRVPPPGAGAPVVQELTSEGESFAPWKVALTPTGQGDDVHVVTAAETASRGQSKPWIVRWYGRDDASGREVASGERLLDGPEPVPLYARSTPAGTTIVGWAQESAPWRLTVDHTGAVVHKLAPAALSATEAVEWFAPVRASLVFGGRELGLRRRVWAMPQAEDVVVATRSWHRSGGGASAVTWLGDAFGVAVAQFDGSSWDIVTYRVQCGSPE